MVYDGREWEKEKGGKMLQLGFEGEEWNGRGYGDIEEGDLEVVSVRIIITFTWSQGGMAAP
jgi:hypothetical protein